MLIIVKMSTNVGILTFMSMINSMRDLFSNSCWVIKSKFIFIFLNQNICGGYLKRGSKTHVNSDEAGLFIS